MKLNLKLLTHLLRIHCLSFAEKVTGTVRHFPKMEWSDKSYVHNVFRSFEYFFGKDIQIRPYSSISVQEVEKGVVTVRKEFFCVEAVLAEIETKIRQALGLLAPSPTYPYLQKPAIAFATLVFLGIAIKVKGENALVPFFVGAIAYDNAGGASQGSGTSLTYSYTTSGSNRLMFTSSYGGADGTNITGKTYNSTAMTFLGKVQYPANNSYCHVYYLVAPSTGANNVVVSYNINARMASVTVTYTGAAQSSPIDNWTTKTQANNNVISQAITVSTANCWGYAAEEGSNLTYASVSGNNAITTKRGGYDDAVVVGDSNGTISTGSVTMGFTGSSNHRGILVLAFKPAVTITTTSITKDLKYTVKLPALPFYTSGGKSATDWTTGTSKSTASFAFIGNCLVVDIIWSGGSSSITSVKWNGTENFTFKTSRLNSGGERMEQWVLMNPTQTTSTVDVVIGSAPSHGGIAATGYGRVGATAQHTNAQVTGTSCSLALTVSEGSLIHGVVGAQRAPSASTGTTARQDLTAFFNMLTGSSSSNLSAGSQNINFTYSSITQGAIYCELQPMSYTYPTKSLKYTVKITPSAPTKSLKYEVKTTASAVTKSVQYCVKATPSAKTKSLKYTVKVVPSGVTKSLQYCVKYAPSAKTKSMQYEVKTVPSAPTKSLRYAVKVAIAITKALQYCVKITPSAKTKSLQYEVRLTRTAITKSLQYCVKAPVAVTKSLQYEVKITANAVTKSVQYCVKITPSAKTKSLQYCVKKATSITKSLQYEVRRTPSAITKSDSYAVKVVSSKTKSMQYCVKYAPSAKTKSLQYAVKRVMTAITKTARYAVSKGQSAVTKSVMYAVKHTPASISKTGKYTIIKQRSVTKSLAYEVRPITTENITKYLHYSVTTPAKISKSLQYYVLSNPYRRGTSGYSKNDQYSRGVRRYTRY